MRQRRARSVAVAAALCTIAAMAVLAPPSAATPSSVTGAAAPAGAPPVRYVDHVFSDVTVTSDIVYGQADFDLDVDGPDDVTDVRDLHLDLYEPTGDTETARPLIVWIHGGGFSGGSKTTGGSAEFATDWAKRGYVAVSIQYRLGPESVDMGNLAAPEGFIPIVAAYTDARMAIAWLRAHALELGINPEVVVATGYSAGGVTADNLAYLGDLTTGVGTDADPGHVDAIVPIAGATLPQFVQAGEPPALMHHGDQDTRVPYGLAVDLHDELVATSIDSTLHTYPGLGHGLSSVFDALRDESAAWVHDRLLAGHPAPTFAGNGERTVVGAGTLHLIGTGTSAPASVRADQDGTYLPTGVWLAGTTGAPRALTDAVSGGWTAGVGGLPVGFHHLWVSTRGGLVPPGWHSRLAVADGRIDEPPPFTDVHPTNPFASHVSWAAATELTEGYPDGTFGAARVVTRQAMIAFLYRIAGAPDGADPTCESTPFVDIAPGHPFCGEIEWAKANGVTDGYPDGSFRATDPLTRQAMAALLHRTSGEPDVPSTFPDVPPGHPFDGDIGWLAATDLSTGYADGTFRPGGYATRLALVAMLSRAYSPGAIFPG